MDRCCYASIVALLIVGLLSPSCWAQETLAKPTVTLPSQWELIEETPYPGVQSNYDPVGAGVLKFANQSSSEVVWIFYEMKQTPNLSPEELEAEAVGIFERDDLTETRALDDSGVAAYADVSAGYATGYDDTDGTYVLEAVLLKGEYYLNVYAWYIANEHSESAVNSLIDSISISDDGTISGDFMGSTTFYIIIAVVAVLVTIAVLFVFMKRKKKKTQPWQPTPYYIPPPPPP